MQIERVFFVEPNGGRSDTDMDCPAATLLHAGISQFGQKAELVGHTTTITDESVDLYGAFTLAC